MTPDPLLEPLIRALNANVDGLQHIFTELRVITWLLITLIIGVARLIWRGER